MLIAASIVSLSWPIADFGRFVYRAADPLPIDVALGAVALLARARSDAPIRRLDPARPRRSASSSTGGPDRSSIDIGLGLIAHRGYGLDRLVGTLYMTLEGIFGVPLDVASTYIILFTIYGAVLEQSGAGRFFIDWSMAAMGRSRSGAAPGRTVTVAGFLLGTVSGSGVATTVMLGSVAWPLLRGAGYRPEVAGAILSAAGIGALISPPTLGAAAFLIAEFLKISYLQVLVMATIPTLLYYLSILLMIEADARRLGTRGQMPDVEPAGTLFRRVRLPLHVARRDRGVHGRRDVRVPRGVLGDDARRRLELSAPGDGADAARAWRRRSRAAPPASSASAPPRPRPASSSAS